MQNTQTATASMKRRRPGRPVSLANLSSGGHLCACSIRQWVVSNHLGRCTGCDLFRPHHDFSCTDAIGFLQQFMTHLARGAKRQIEIRHLEHPELSYDELSLLRLVALAGHGGRPRYARHLARGLVDDPAIEYLCWHASGYRARLGAAVTSRKHDKDMPGG